MANGRTDAERRARQCQRLARVLRILRLVAGHGRWGPGDLAKEIECSQRTIFRDIEALSTSGVPIYYDRDARAYRLQEGFKFPGLEPAKGVDIPGLTDLISSAEQFLRDGTRVLAELRSLCRTLEGHRRKE